jgi:uncharacterized membrane protein
VDNSRTELISASIIVLSLWGIAAYYVWRQMQLFKRLRQSDSNIDDRQFYRAQGVRRLVSSALMAIMGVVLAANYWTGLTSQHPDKTNAFTILVWTFFSILFLAVIVMAFLDVRATRRYGIRQYRQLQADRREMIEREVARLRSERDGH